MKKSLYGVVDFKIVKVDMKDYDSSKELCDYIIGVDGSVYRYYDCFATNENGFYLYKKVDGNVNFIVDGKLLTYDEIIEMMDITD